jgi:hypothetical protein
MAMKVTLLVRKSAWHSASSNMLRFIAGDDACEYGPGFRP